MTKLGRLVTRFLVVLVGAGVLAAIFVPVGFNLHRHLSQEYSGGYEADLSFIPKLATTVWDYRSREHAIVDATEQRELLATIGSTRIGIYRPWPSYRIPVYDGLKELGLNVSIVKPSTDVEKIVDSFDVIIFPQGGYHLRELPPGEGERLREAVKKGVHYVGLCAGALLAVNELGIAPIEHRRVNFVGIMRMRTLGEGYWGDLGERSYQVHYANGGYFPADGLGNFQPLAEARNFGYTAVRGRYGSGEVVLFTFHPEGGGLTLNNESVYFNGRDLGSGALLLQSLQNLGTNG